MSRPRPLQNLTAASGRVLAYQPLTPRTPHSRAGLAEEALDSDDHSGLDEVDIDGDRDYRSHRQQQIEPLLTSSASASFPPSGRRNHGDDYSEKSSALKPWEDLTVAKVLRWVPLAIGIILGAILLGAIVISYKHPDLVEHLAGTSQATSTTGGMGMSMPDSISYVNYTKFPLTGSQYRYECGELNKGYMHHGSFWSKGNHTLDVPHIDEKHGYSVAQGEVPICNTTITYLLDGHVGLLASLALMAQTAALARERNRTFFVDDTHWNRGKWTDHFQDVRLLQAGPEPGCKAPPPEELVACPRTARHWVMSSSTAKFHLGHAFQNDYQNSYGRGINRLEPIFNSSALSFNSTILPNAETQALIDGTRKELGKQSYIAVHIRQGDRESTSWKYHTKPVPLPEFVDAINATWQRFLPPSTMTRPVIYIASDSPQAQLDLIELLPKPTRIYSLARSENVDMREYASTEAYNQTEFNAWKDEEKRVRATTGMIIDFALVNGMWPGNEEHKAPEATICTITSNVCRLSPVALGWDRAFGDTGKMGSVNHQSARWVEIDAKGGIVPEWEAFELFN